MKPVNTQLDPHLLARARELERLTAVLLTDLPAECDGHFHVARIQDDTVYIVTDSPVWTTRLRQLAPRIIQILQGHGQPRCRHARIISRMDPVVNKPTPAAVRRRLSHVASEGLRQTSSYVSDPALSNALRRLARHSGKKS